MGGTIIIYHQDQLSITSNWSRQIKYSSIWLGFRHSAHTYAGWLVTMCDPIWQVTLHSSEMGFNSTEHGKYQGEHVFGDEVVR